MHPDGVFRRGPLRAPPDAGDGAPPAWDRSAGAGLALSTAATPERAVRLPWLLEIAGQAGHGDLLDHLARDLGAARAALLDGLRDGDAVRVEHACHVLVALAGTLGDSALTARVQALQRRLRGAAAPGRAQDLHPGLAEALDALGAEIATARAARGRHGGA